MTSWKPLVRVGVPQVKDIANKPGRLTVNIKVAKSLHPSEWLEYFNAKTDALSGGVNGHTQDELRLYYEIDDADLESLIATVDKAIEFANTTYERINLPEVIAAKEAEAAAKDAAAARQAELDERAARLAGKPDLPKTSRNL